VTNGDLLKARVVELNGRYEVGVTLTAQGAGKMKDATSRHVGRPLAIILDGEIVAVQRVGRAVESEVVISADFTQQDATRIVAGLNKW
jgi:preprotein translocase subunit SecD